MSFEKTSMRREKKRGVRAYYCHYIVALGGDCGHAGTAAHSIRWREVDLARQPKGNHIKVKIAQQLRAQTPMSRQWIADRLRMGSPSYVSNLLTSVDSKL
jgi:hypothetical protein